MIAIIGAMDSEIEALLQQLKLQKTVTFADKVLYLGVLRGHDVLIAKSGIGKVNTAMMTTYVLSHYKIDFLINIGVAGG
ncbi:MAG: 5'-methylthioadenosine/S-adenosylhomocysteine nucleosidase, partial [Acholeplasmataceae bacterium]|nr:5'-methylthioadenosine/S-adenosylhomocysteine nucleosidase [Acholeplasmataceae bacterium]